MNIVISGYGENEQSMKLYSVDLVNKKVNVKDGLVLTQPSFVITYKEDGKTYAITYSKQPLQLINYEIKNDKFYKVDNIYLDYESLTHLVYDYKTKRLYGCSYKDGMFLRLDIKEGKFSNLKAISNPKPSLCHQIVLVDELVGVIDIKNDKLNLYDKDLNYIKSYTYPEGVGPRHAWYYNNHIYTVTEYSNEIYVMDKDGNIIQGISTLKDKNIVSYGATVLERNGYIYATNRGEETVAKFKVNDDATLTYVNAFPCFGVHPRHMILSDDKKYIISCNKDSNNVSIIDIEKEELVVEFEFYQAAGVANV